jgi:hypothetical protein
MCRYGNAMVCSVWGRVPNDRQLAWKALQSAVDRHLVKGRVGEESLRWCDAQKDLKKILHPGGLKQIIDVLVHRKCVRERLILRIEGDLSEDVLAGRCEDLGVIEQVFYEEKGGAIAVRLPLQACVIDTSMEVCLLKL